MYDSERYFFETLRAGASGYVLKSVADQDLVEACRAVMRGEPFIYPAALTALMRNVFERAQRQHQDVERHRADILQKLEMRDRTELSRYAIRSGLIEA